ncbi:MAG: tRNA uracil 4-sulfurtransferase ThiI [Thermoanaerobaculia bacterium]
MPSADTVLVRFAGDLTTKSRGTRVHFLRRLHRNLREAYRREEIEAEVERQWGRVLVSSRDPRAAEVASRIFGVQSVSRAVRRPWSSLDDLVVAGVELFGDAVAGKRFAVRARRSGDRRDIPFQSIDVERALGTALLARAAGVDLDDPEVTAHLEIHRGDAYFFTSQIAGPGGLPLGVEGQALALISGGFDSAVAAWQMMKRGVAVDFLFFNLGGRAHEEGVQRITKLLAETWVYGHRPVLHAVDFRPVVEDLQAATRSRFWQVLLKRLMMRAASQVARELELPALVTGEAVGQVSSQTLQNLAVIDAAAALPVFRPLLTYNKDEIITLARRLGTFEISAGVEEFCAIVARRPATAARADEVEAEEAKLEPAALTAVIGARRAIDLRGFEPATARELEIAVDAIPDGARLVDLRSRTAYDAWHPEGAEWMDYFATLHRLETLAAQVPWVFYCEVGLKSADLAERLRARRVAAWNLAGGVRGLLRRAQAEEPLLAALAAPAVRG